MTDQERPVEERNDLLDNLLNAASVAVQEREASQQEQAGPAADEQPEPAAQAGPAADEQPEPAAQAGPAADEQTTQAAAEPTATTEERTTEETAEPVSSAEADDQASSADASADDAADTIGSATPEATIPPTDVVEPTTEETAEPVSSAEADDRVSGVEASAETVADTAESTTPEATTPPADAVEPVAAASSAADEVAGASYTPVDEEESGRPRRVKDLEPGMELEGRVTSIALYGIFVDIGVGRDGLVHISEMSDTRIDSPSDIVQIGDTVKVRIKSVEPDGRRISLTMRSKERGEQRQRGRKRPELNREALAALKVGENVEGTVTGIAPFGVFVDIGVGKDGLVHVSELAEGRIEKPEDAVQIGQTYTFKILEIDADGTRISLSLRRAQRGQRMQQLEKGQILEGTVSGLAPFGAFVDIGVGRDGLIHISEMSDTRIGKVEDAVKVGDKVTVRVLDVDSQSKRISLSMRLEDRPREEPAPRGESATEAREERSRREDRGPRAPRQEAAPVEPAPVADETGDEAEEVFEGNATLEDLLSKFSSGKRDRKRRQDDEEEEDEEDRYTRRQRDAIRRTLQQMSDEE